MIDQATIDRINDAARIEDVVGDYVTLKRRGVTLIGLCPFHNEKTPSFNVSPAKGIFKCFGCGKGGNAVHFIMEIEQLNYYEALKFLARKYHIEVHEKELTPEEVAARNERESLFLVNEYAQKYFTDTLWRHVDGKAVGMSYFHERGFRDDIIRKFQLGYSLDQRDAFTRAALKAGYNKDYLVKTGLTMEYDDGRLNDRFRGRVMFPVHSLSGKVVAFGGRVLRKSDKMAKYVNSPESDIYHKSNELYGIYFAKQAIVREDRCYLVEGYTDVISMHQCGIENVVASSGTSLTGGQIRLIHRFTNNVTVLYDGDAAGIKASIRGIDLLLEEGMNIQVLLLPDGDDPDSFAKSHNASDFIAFIKENSTDFIRFKTKLLMEDAGNDPIKRAGLVTDIVRSIAIIPDQIIRAEYVRECSNLLNVGEQTLYYEINKIKGREREKRFAEQHRQGTSAPAPVPPETPLPTLQEVAAGRFEQEERNLLQVLIKYGHLPLFKDEEAQRDKTVAEYIVEELDCDGLVLENPLHRQVLDEYRQHLGEAGFQAERHFLNHPDGRISRLAADLIADKYVLSRVHTRSRVVPTDEERLLELVPRLVLELKNSVVLDHIKQKLLEMKAAGEAKDYARIDILMEEIKQLDEVKKQLAKALGERIINRI